MRIATPRASYQNRRVEATGRGRVPPWIHYTSRRALHPSPSMATLGAGRIAANRSAYPMAHDRENRPPTERSRTPAAGATRAEIDAFLAQVKGLAPTTAAGQRGRLIFALDATMSRQPMWDSACRLQADMFREAAAIGGLDVQLVYFRGLSECRASRWVSDGAGLGELMGRIDCQGGHTQIRKVFSHARTECHKAKVQALVYVGDAMEEAIDDLAAGAGELGLLGVPAFMFQEGHDPIAEQ